MNRKEFLRTLEQRLTPLSSEVRQELLEDMEQHFTFGLNSGKTEEEIARELGDPEDIAREALGDIYSPTDFAASIPPAAEPVRTTFVVIGLFFLNLMLALPILASIWSVWLGLAAAAIGGILAPLAAAGDFIITGTYYPYKLFMSIGMVGIGILLFLCVRLLLKGLVKGTVSYCRWNQTTVKGRKG